MRLTYEEIAKLRFDDPWSEVPEFPRAEWRRAVAAEETQSGYWDWCLYQADIQQ